MTKKAPSRGRVGRFETLTLENRFIRATVIPELGGRIWQLEDRARGREWIWHRDGVGLTKAAVGDSYDDVWAGGWEELFPNDAPGHFEGRDLPDHGEWWAMAWGVVAASGSSLNLACQSKVVNAVCSKGISLAADEASVTVTYRIRSMERRAFHFLFKQHLPIRITSACRLVLPGGKVEAVDPSFSTLLPGRGPYSWPCALGKGGAAVDLQEISPQSCKTREFVYVRDLPESWCGVDDLERGASLRMSFDAKAVPYVWLFLSYGGWRDAYTAVLEPCTNMPKDLGEAARRGQSACLQPGEEFVTSVSVSLSDYTQAPSST